MNVEEHLRWALTRALEYVDRGDLLNAMASFSSDLNQYEGHPADIAAYDPVALMRAFERGRPAVEQLMRQLEMVRTDG